jgi:hypothetical protein
MIVSIEILPTDTAFVGRYNKCSRCKRNIESEELSTMFFDEDNELQVYIFCSGCVNPGFTQNLEAYENQEDDIF